MYEIRIKDDRIPAYRVIKGQFQQDAEAKAQAQIAIWEARWKRMQASEVLRNSKQSRLNLIIHGKQEASSLTDQARAGMKELDGLLLDGCNEPRCTWEALKDREPFRQPAPAAPFPLKQPTEPAQWVAEQIPELPAIVLPQLGQPKLTLREKLVPGLKKARLKEVEARYEQAKHLAERQQADAQAHRNDLQQRQFEAKTAHEQAVAHFTKERHRIDELATKAKADYTSRVNEWQKNKAAYVEAQRDQHTFIDRLALAYEEGSSEAVEYLTSEALTRSSLPEPSHKASISASTLKRGYL